MTLGAFSVSLTVKDLATSRAFYEKLGFEVFAGDDSLNYLILRNGECRLGLFQGMFEKNILTFNPGWNPDGKAVEEFTDVRELQKQFKAAGISPDIETDESTTGPASFVISDPDGNPILFDQHV